MSPNLEEEQATADEMASGPIPEGQSLPKDEPQSRKDSVKNEVATLTLEPRLRKNWMSKTQTVRILTPCVRNCRIGKKSHLKTLKTP